MSAEPFQNKRTAVEPQLEDLLKLQWKLIKRTKWKKCYPHKQLLNLREVEGINEGNVSLAGYGEVTGRRKKSREQRFPVWEKQMVVGDKATKRKEWKRDGDKEADWSLLSLSAAEEEP